MTTYAVALSDEPVDWKARDRPLELADIMPVEKRMYDKMRPPKYKGKTNFMHYLKPLKKTNEVICYSCYNVGVSQITKMYF
jgi:hypothetical protein